MKTINDGKCRVGETARGRGGDCQFPVTPTLPLSHTQRSAFSLVELLVVMSIMALLMTLAIVVVGDIFGTAKRQATVATIKKVDELFTTRMDAFHRWLQTQGDANIALAGNERGLVGTNQALALVLGRKEYFRHYFPQMFTESPTAISGGPTHNPNTESSECLYFLLTHAEAFGAEPIGEDTFSTSEVADTDGDGLKEIVDGWERPLRFYRWTTRLVRPDGINVDTTFIRPLMGTSIQLYKTWQPNVSYVVGDLVVPVTFSERLFRCTNAGTTGGMEPAWTTMVGSTVMDNTAQWTAELDPFILRRDSDDQLGLINSAVNAMQFDAATFENNYHTMESYHAPLIMSAGPDGDLGLYEPNDVANHGHLAQPLPDTAGNPTKTTVDELTDNIANLNQRAGTGKKK